MGTRRRKPERMRRNVAVVTAACATQMMWNSVRSKDTGTSLSPASAGYLLRLLFDSKDEEGSIFFCEALCLLRTALYKSEIFLFSASFYTEFHRSSKYSSHSVWVCLFGHGNMGKFCSAPFTLTPGVILYNFVPPKSLVYNSNYTQYVIYI
jgi:hypothetical protein